MKVRYSQVVKGAAAVAAIAAGVVILTGWPGERYSEVLFVAAISAVAAVYVWPGVRKLQAKAVAVVLFLLAAYALAQGFGWMDLSWLKRLGGVFAIVSGAFLLWPVVHAYRQSRNRAG